MGFRNELFSFSPSKRAYSSIEFTKRFSGNLYRAIYTSNDTARQILAESSQMYIYSSSPRGKFYDVIFKRLTGTFKSPMGAKAQKRTPNSVEQIIATNTITDSLGRQRKQNVFQRYQIFFDHTASAPGQPPAILSGSLFDRIASKRATAGGFSVGVIGSDPKNAYGRLFEGRPANGALNTGGSGAMASAAFKVISSSMVDASGAKGLYGSRPFMWPAFTAQKNRMRILYRNCIHLFSKRYVGFQYK